MRRILITGSNGLLGQKLVALFSTEEDIKVIATSRGSTKINVQNVSYLDLELSNRSAVLAAISKAAPTHIIHAAAIADVNLCESEKELCWKNNVVSSENIIEAAIELNSHLLYISTDFVFDGEGGPYVEKDPPNPINFYGKSKHAVEQLLQNSELDYSIVRTVLVYGTGKQIIKSNIVTWTKSKLEKGEPIRVVNDQWRSPTLVEDLANGCRLMLDQEAKGIFHIAGREYITPYDISMKTAEAFGLDNSLISPTNASEFKEVARRPLKTGLDISKAQVELGYEPVSLERGLKIVKEQLDN